MSKPTDKEIRDEENEAGIDACDEKCKFPGMSYSQGVSAALRWVLGDEEEPPYTAD